MVKNVDNDWKDERLEAFIASNKLADYDIICFQEIFDFLNFNRRQKLITYAQKAGYFYHAVSDPAPIFSNAFIDGGLLTISRFPIIEQEFKSYDYGVLSDALSYKGVLFTKIKIA
jgi:sphingomyelin phosphodiesterase